MTCVCTHSPVSHRHYRECAVDGCTCWQYRRANQSTNRNARAAVAAAPGHDPQEMTP